MSSRKLDVPDEPTAFDRFIHDLAMEQFEYTSRELASYVKHNHVGDDGCDDIDSMGTLLSQLSYMLTDGTPEDCREWLDILRETASDSVCESLSAHRNYLYDLDDN